MIRFTAVGWADYASWSDNRKVLQRINRMLAEAARDPRQGIGKPEPLVGDLAGCWSRRIDHEHRLVYLVVDGDVVVLQARRHY